MSKPYQISLPQFEGPFDLLLFFIERDELDIYDIPIAKITDDFLATIHEMKLLNIEMASEFILVAATLMKIKSRMLLPRKELNADGIEIDPREELVQRLLEYKKFKAVSDQLSTLEDIRQMMLKRGNAREESLTVSSLFETDTEMESLTLFKLLKAFEQVLKRHEISKQRVVHEVTPYSYTIGEEKSYIMGRMRSEKKVDFEHVFIHIENRVHAIFLFLAILELIQERSLEIIIGEGINNFWITEAEVLPGENS